MTLLLSLMGEQPIPNLLPLWQSGEYDATCFAATPTTLPLAHSLAEVIRNDPHLKQLQVLDPLELQAYDMAQCRAVLSQMLVAQRAAGRAVRLNLTGGTKIMSLAALQAAFGSGVPLLYVSTQQNEIIHYQSDGSEVERQPIAVQISVAQYLQAHGLETSLSLSFNRDEPDFHPPKEGDPLEEQVYRLALESGAFDDVQRGLYIRREARIDAVVNELDVVVTRNGRLAVCSCKSGKMNNDALYQLSALSRRESAGIYCGKVLASSLPELAPGIRDRAAADHIHLVYGSEIENVVEHLILATR